MELDIDAEDGAAGDAPEDLFTQRDRARSQRDVWLAKTAELEYRKSIGELVERAPTIKAAEEAFIALAGLLDRLPDRCFAPLLAGVEDIDEARLILDDAIRDVHRNDRRRGATKTQMAATGLGRRRCAADFGAQGEEQCPSMIGSSTTNLSGEEQQGEWDRLPLVNRPVSEECRQIETAAWYRPV